MSQNYSPNFEDHIHTHTEVIKEVHRELKIFNRNNTELLHIVKYQQRGEHTHSEFLKYFMEDHLFVSEWDHDY